MPKLTSWLVRGFAALVLTAGLFVLPVAATGVRVHVNTPGLVVTDVPSSSVVVQSTPFVLTGDVNQLSQIRLYIDRQFVDVIPLSATATTFQYDLNVNPGMHAVTLVGIGDNGPIAPVSFSIGYQPLASSGLTNQPSGAQKTPSSGGVSIGGPGVQRSSSGLHTLAGLPGFEQLYSGLIFLDIVRPGGGVGSTPQLLLVLLACILLIFPRAILTAYRTVRYRWLGWRRRALPASIRTHSLAVLRVIGIVLIIAVICLV